MVFQGEGRSVHQAIKLTRVPVSPRQTSECGSQREDGMKLIGTVYAQQFVPSCLEALANSVGSTSSCNGKLVTA